MKFGLPDSVVERIGAVLARYPQVDQAILYGSRAKGTQRNGSDIDLTLRGGSDLDGKVLFRLIDELDELLLPYQIDLSLHADIRDPSVLEHIARVGSVFYTKQTEVEQT